MKTLLTTPTAIVIGAVLGAFVLVVGAKVIGQSVWIALSAIGTFSAVVVALHRDFILRWWGRPILEIGPYEMVPPYFQEAPQLRKVEVDGLERGTLIGIGLYVNILLMNVGQTLAKNCQPLVTAVGRINDGKWQEVKNWTPLGLEWVLDETAQQATGKPTEERDLIPRKPYFFNLGCASTRHEMHFKLLVTTVPTAQNTMFPPGQYCFEIVVYGERVKPVTKYFHVEWDGMPIKSSGELAQKIRVFAADHPPW
jgi:hypothetical protein